MELMRSDFHLNYLWLRALQYVIDQAPITGTLDIPDSEFLDIFCGYRSPYKA